MGHVVKLSRTLTGSSAAVKSTDTPDITGNLLCVALEKATAGAGGVSSSNPIRIGRGSSDDLILENVLKASTAVLAFYPGRMMCSTAGTAYASTDGGMSFGIPFDTEPLSLSINAATSALSKVITVHAWFDGIVYSTSG